jgi:hypothetical protein
MKRICLTLFSILSVYQFSMAQWTTSGTNIYNSNTGFVGIGTTTPDAKLVVAGSGIVENLTNTLDQDLKFSLTTTGATDKYALIAPSTATNLAFGVASTEKMRITNSGNVGIGTATPQANLELKATPSYDGTTMLRITNNSYDYGRTNLVLTGRIENGNDSWNFGSGARNSIVFSENAATTGLNIGAIGDEKFSMQLEGNSNSLGFLSKQNGSAPTLVLTQGGNVCIGTTNPQGYLLAVAGSAIATSVTIKTVNNWPDYVFKKDYQLPTLQEVKTYIDQNQHLPEMPSEQDITKDGLNVGEMNRLLTKKVEELTLYLIEKDNKDKEQAVQLSSQQEQINKLKGQIELLIKNAAKQ